MDIDRLGGAEVVLTVSSAVIGAPVPRNEQAVLDMLDEIDRARLGVLSLDELEEKLWRLLDQTDESFPPVLSGRVEDFVLELKRLQAENLATGARKDVDENRGFETVFQEVQNALSRFLG